MALDPCSFILQLIKRKAFLPPLYSLQAQESTVFAKQSEDEDERSTYTTGVAPFALVFCAFYEHCQDEPTCQNRRLVAWKSSKSFVHKTTLYRPFVALRYKMSPGRHYCCTPGIPQKRSFRPACPHIGSKFDIRVFCHCMPRLSNASCKFWRAFQAPFSRILQYFARLCETCDVGSSVQIPSGFVIRDHPNSICIVNYRGRHVAAQRR